MSAPKHSLKLIYFAIRARGEHIRMTLKAAGVPFDDEHISFDQWTRVKQEMPLGQVPVLVVDGTTKIAQSRAIARFVGDEYGLSAATPLERARLDMVSDAIADGIDQTRDWIRVCLGFKTDVPDKAAFFSEKIRPKVQKKAAEIEKILAEGGDASGPFLLGEKMTWADIYAAEYFARCADLGEKDIIDAFPRVRTLVDRVQNAPGIKEHIAQRKPMPA